MVYQCQKSVYRVSEMIEKIVNRAMAARTQALDPSRPLCKAVQHASWLM